MTQWSKTISENNGTGTMGSNAKLEVAGDTIIGTDDSSFYSIKEILGTTTASGNVTSVALPSGWTKEDSIYIMSIKIEVTDNNWHHFVNEEATNVTICNITDDTIFIYHGDNATYHSKGVKVLLMHM